jgi:hypothetical protein
MRREVFALVLCACASKPATSTFDSGAQEPPAVDYSPGPDDAVDASAPMGVACTPGTVRVVATTSQLLDGPRVDDSFVYWSEIEPEADAMQGYWWSGVLALHRAGKNGENPVRLFGTEYRVTNLEGFPYFTVDATSAYWIAYTGGGFGDIMRGAKDGSLQHALVSGVPTPRALEIAGDTLFFESGSSLYSIGVDRTNERVVRETWSATEYVIGATHVYAVDQGRIVSVTRTGEILEPLVELTVGVTYEGLSVGDDGYFYVIQKNGEPSFSKISNVLAVPTDGKTPSVIVPSVQTYLPASEHLFTASDGDCLVYTTRAGVFRRCAGADIAMGPGEALEAPVVDSTSIYWRAHTDAATTVIYAACKL